MIKLKSNGELTKELLIEIVMAIRDDVPTNGEAIKKLEEEFKKYIGTDYAFAINNWEMGILIILKSLGSWAFDANVRTGCIGPYNILNCIHHSGRYPYFVDVEMHTYNIDLSDPFLHTPRPQVIIVSHLHGRPANVDKYSHKTIIEDCSQALGAAIRVDGEKQKVGSFGLCGVFDLSFNSCGSGAIITTNNVRMADKIDSMRNSGLNKKKHEHKRIGFEARLNSIDAAIARTKLKYADQNLSYRKKLSRLYIKLLEDIDVLRTPMKETSNLHAWNIFGIRVPEQDRTPLRVFLYDNGIETDIHYPKPLNKYNLFHTTREFPNGEQLSNELLSLPLYNTIPISDIHYITKKIKEFYRSE